MIKNVLLTSVLACLPVFSVFANPSIKINGNLAEKEPAKLQFDGDNAQVVFSDGSSFNYDMESVEIVFGSSSSAEMVPSFYSLNTEVDDVLSVSGLEVGQDLKIFASSGMMLFQSKATAQTENINISRLSKGVYILTIGNTSIKFIKK